jgi:hypothetical protein
MTFSAIGHLYSSIPTHSLLRSEPNSSTELGFDVFLPNAQWALNDLFVHDSLFSRFAESVVTLRIKNTDEPDEDLPATAFSVAQVFYLVPLSRLVLSQKWEAPHLVTDGYGGIRMTWSSNGRDVRVSIPAQEGEKRRLYWEQGDLYGSLSDVTPTTLSKYLRWITNDGSSLE